MKPESGVDNRECLEGQEDGEIPKRKEQNKSATTHPSWLCLFYLKAKVNEQHKPLTLAGNISPRSAKTTGPNPKE